MIERGRRFIIWLAMAAFSVAMLFDGPGAFPGGGAVSFLGEAGPDPSRVTVRLSGNVEKPGVYYFPAGSDAETVTIMTLTGKTATNAAAHHAPSPLRSGEVFEIFEKDGKLLEITRKEMGAEEKVLLGIPLDLNRMSRSDWEYLPGIGGTIAKKLVEYRQINGDFASPDDLKRVPGIGAARLRKIEGFFRAL